jgi:hypothetical protein
MFRHRLSLVPDFFCLDTEARRHRDTHGEMHSLWAASVGSVAAVDVAP